MTDEVKSFIAKLSLPNCFEQRIPQITWKRLVKKAINEANEHEIRVSTNSYKKMKDKVKDDETFECKDYLAQLPLSQARTMFQHKYSMTENVKMNYKGDPTYAKSLWKCQECGNQDSEKHLLWCSGYAELRKDLDLDVDKDLCSYLQKIIQIRCKEK